MSDCVEPYSSSAVNDDTRAAEYSAIVPVVRDTDGAGTTDCDSGDWSAEVERENSQQIKQEPEDVCYIATIIIYRVDQKFTSQSNFKLVSFKSVRVQTHTGQMIVLVKSGEPRLEYVFATLTLTLTFNLLTSKPCHF